MDLDTSTEYEVMTPDSIYNELDDTNYSSITETEEVFTPAERLSLEQHNLFTQWVDDDRITTGLEHYYQEHSITFYFNGD